MNEKRECRIVQDLLPNYIEKLTNEETSKYIEEHLNNCGECKKIFENMKKEIYLNNNKKDDREVKYIKKYNKKMKILKSIILLIIIAYIAIITRRMWILSSLSKKAEESLKQNNNYHAKYYVYEGERTSIQECFYKEGNFITIMNEYKEGDKKSKWTFYLKDNDKLQLLEAGDKRYIYNNHNMIGWKLGVSTELSMGFFSDLQSVPFMTIENGYCNGKECYIIKRNNEERYVEKDTGLVVRRIYKYSKNSDEITDSQYEFGVVKDEDIIKPKLIGNEEIIN